MVDEISQECKLALQAALELLGEKCKLPLTAATTTVEIPEVGSVVLTEEVTAILKKNPLSHEERVKAIAESDWARGYGRGMCGFVTPDITGKERETCIERLARRIAERVAGSSGSGPTEHLCPKCGNKILVEKETYVVTCQKCGTGFDVKKGKLIERGPPSMKGYQPYL